MELYESDKPTKRFVAIFDGNKRVNFGSRRGDTYIDHNNDDLRLNYIKRHSKLNEDWTDPQTPGALSRYLLWEYKDLHTALKSYKKRFKL